MEYRGGKRKGSGRKKKGITRKVSLTLTEDFWNEINEFDGTVADYIRSLKKIIFEKSYLKQRNIVKDVERRDLLEHNQSEDFLKEVTLIKETSTKLTREYVEELIRIYVANYIREHGETSQETINFANTTILNNLFDKQGTPQIETSMRYRSPFNNKWFSSIDNMLKTELPRLVEYSKNDIKRERERRIKALQEKELKEIIEAI